MTERETETSEDERQKLVIRLRDEADTAERLMIEYLRKRDEMQRQYELQSAALHTAINHLAELAKGGSK